MADPIIAIERLRKDYTVRGNGGRNASLRAVDEIDLSVTKGQSVGIVGESGCGKTTTARMLLLLEKPTSGRVLFDGEDVHAMGRRDQRRYRAAVQPVFQDPYSSLSPRLRVGSIVGEPLHALAHVRGSELRDRVRDSLVQVGLPSDAAGRYPYQFSGGQRQRIALARALALRPRLIVLDEPVSSLDVSVRAVMLNLLKDLEEELGLTYVLIAHDLPTLRFLVSEVAVMYLGRIVERGPAEHVFTDPQHPYTQALLSAVPSVTERGMREDIVLGGELPSAIDASPGCAFRTRCPFAMPVCAEQRPPLEPFAGTLVACHLTSRAEVAS